VFTNIRWRIATSFAILILSAMLVLAGYLTERVRQDYLAGQREQMVGQARLVAADAAGTWGQPAALEALARRESALLQARVTLIAADGTVLAESEADLGQATNHLDRPEVQRALAGEVGTSVRRSSSLGETMMYVAAPVPGGLGVARVALPLAEVDARVAGLQRTILLATVPVTLAAIAIALLVAERTARPVRWLIGAAERMAEGDFAPLSSTTRDEIGQLTHALDRMGARLQEQMAVLAAERGRLAAILEHMADGVIITDGAGRVRLINPAAARLLGTGQASALGQPIAQALRHHRLIQLWQQAEETGQEQVQAVELDPQDLLLQAIVTPLATDRRTAEPDRQGFLIILQDLTRIRRLETVRRDFVSNISHELRTPLASLKALVDTLRDGALEDPPAAQRFLDRMDTEVDAMTQMVQELLELSRIESGQVPLRLQPVAVAEVVAPPTERLRPQAERAGLTLSLAIPWGLPPVLADAERVQQVVTNLVHNAIKFTPAGGEVAVAATAQQGEVVISVRDTGVGIPAADLPRIFERFYKADRARRRGGTGLGLAIAKHIVQGHGGRLWAESREGHGSTFYFSLRAAGGQPLAGSAPHSNQAG